MSSPFIYNPASPNLFPPSLTIAAPPNVCKSTQPLVSRADNESVRLRDRIARLFMDDAQRSLHEPQRYREHVDARAILAEVDAGAAGRMDHETLGAMRSAIRDLGIDRDGYLTIARVVDAKRSMDEALSQPHDPSLHEFGVIANCGHSALASYLIGRANLLSQGIKPGASQMLAQAFG